MQCLTLAIDHPPEPGEYRVFNQFEEVYDVGALAEKVQKVGNELGLDVSIRNTENPRVELEEHYYNPDHEHLRRLGYQPTHDVEQELRFMFEDLVPQRARIESKKHALIPDIFWSGRRKKVSFL
jgi:UDP-sulfoquinovose synthase